MHNIVSPALPHTLQVCPQDRGAETAPFYWEEMVTRMLSPEKRAVSYEL